MSASLQSLAYLFNSYNGLYVSNNMHTFVTRNFLILSCEEMKSRIYTNSSHDAHSCSSVSVIVAHWSRRLVVVGITLPWSFLLLLPCTWFIYMISPCMWTSSILLYVSMPVMMHKWHVQHMDINLGLMNSTGGGLWDHMKKKKILSK